MCLKVKWRNKQMPLDCTLDKHTTHYTRVADGGFVCTSMSRPKLFKNYLIGGH